MRLAVRTVATVVLVVLGVLLVGPQQFGGPVAMVSTFGDSMLPTYEPQHLVMLRRAPGYEVGDVVAYRSPQLDAVVLHRIVDADADGFVTKGDNNDWLDPDLPTTDDIIGKAWLSVPEAGRLLELPPPLRIGLLGLVLLPSGIRRMRRVSNRPKGRTSPRQRRQRPTIHQEKAPMSAHPMLQQQLTAASLVALTGGLLLGVFAMSQPTRVAAPVSYTHQGEFSYSAEAPSGPVYPDGTVGTGDPVFRQLVDAVDVRYDWSLDAELPTDLSGTQRLLVEVSDGSGWRHELSLGSPEAFDGAEGSLEGRLDLPAIERLARRVQGSTGVEASGLQLTVVVEIDADGVLAGVPLETSYRPTALFRLEPLRLVPPAGEDGADGLTVTEAGELSVPDREAATAAIGPVEAEVALLRTIAAALIALGVLLGVAAVILRFRGGRPTELDRTRRRLGRPVIEVTGMRLPQQRTLVSVASPEALADLSDQLEQPILQAPTSQGGTALIIVAGSTCYRYAVPGTTTLPANASPEATAPTRPDASPKATTPDGPDDHGELFANVGGTRSR